MFCPKCGTTIEKGVSTCKNCEYDITDFFQKPIPLTKSDVKKTIKTKPTITKQMVTKPTTTNQDATNQDALNTVVEKIKGNPLKVSFSGLAVGVFIMFFIAAHFIETGGIGIMQIQSVGGQTMEEAYYFELGSIYTGYAIITRAFGLFFSAVLIWLGQKSN